LLGFASGVTSEEHPETAVFEHEGDRVAVDRITTADEWKRRADKAQPDAVVGAPAGAGARQQDGNALRPGGFDGIAISMPSVDLTAITKLAHSEPSQHRCDAAGVVAVWMRDEQRIDRVDPVSQQKRYDDAFSHAFGNGVVVLRSAFEPATGVHKQRMTARRLNDDRIGLSYVENRHAQTFVQRARRPQHVTRREDDRGDRERAHPPLPQERRAKQGRVVGRDAPCRCGRHRHYGCGKSAHGLDDAEHPREQPRVAVGTGLG
jgi:hypothetical protein